jgi:hypothetical protein
LTASIERVYDLVALQDFLQSFSFPGQSIENIEVPAVPTQGAAGGFV